MKIEIILGLNKDLSEFYSEEGLKLTNYDLNLRTFNFYLEKVIFPLDPEIR
jgi:hypothetical protein